MNDPTDLDDFINSLPVGPARKKSRITPYISALIEMHQRGCSIRDMHSYLTEIKGVQIAYQTLRLYIHRHRIFEGQPEKIQAKNELSHGRVKTPENDIQEESLLADTNGDPASNDDKHPTMFMTKDELDKHADKYQSFSNDGNPLLNHLISKQRK